MRIAIALLILAGCAVAEPSRVTVVFVPTPSNELAAACPSLIGRSAGCATTGPDDVCRIYAPAPKNLEDEEALAVVGHEFYCHCWLKQPHHEANGAPKDPSRDCIDPGT